MTKENKREAIRILNLYSCLGGNRYKWDEVADIEVTAVELDVELAKLYQERFPEDKVIVADAHQYLLDHYLEFDFIWTSPPCPTHSRARYWAVGKNGKQPCYPDMSLYQEVIFLEKHFEGKYCVENVIPYYTPLIPAQERARHLYWTNFKLPKVLSKRSDATLAEKSILKDLSDFHAYNFKKYNGEQRILKIARNLVDYEAGKTILETALGIIRSNNANQTKLFD